LDELLDEPDDGLFRGWDGGRPSSRRTRGAPSPLGPLGLGGASFTGFVGGNSPLFDRRTKCCSPIWMKFVVVQYRTRPRGNVNPKKPKTNGIM
jgi:hypothetical protein